MQKSQGKSGDLKSKENANKLSQQLINLLQKHGLKDVCGERWNRMMENFIHDVDNKCVR